MNNSSSVQVAVNQLGSMLRPTDRLNIKGYIYKVSWTLPKHTDTIGVLSSSFVTPTQNSYRLFISEQDATNFKTKVDEALKFLDLDWIGATSSISKEPYE